MKIGRETSFFHSRGARARGYVDFAGSFYLYIVALQQNPLLVLGHAVFYFLSLIDMFKARSTKKKIRLLLV